MRILLLCFAAILSTLSPLDASTPKSEKLQWRNYLPPYSEVGLGLANSHIKRIQTDELGERNLFKPRPYLQGALTWALPKQFSFSTEAKLGLPHSGRDENIKRLNYEFNFPLSYRAFERWSLRAGPGLAFTRIWGDGGRVSLDNGLDTTDFFLPSQAHTSMNLIWMAGADFAFKPEITFRAEMQVFNLFDSLSRSFSQSLSVHYHFQFRALAN